MAGKTRRKLPEINASSMADIAFLLLVFFLVATTIKSDKGLQILLPPWSDEMPDPEEHLTRNVFSVLVNANNQLLVRGELMELRDLRKNAKEFIANPSKREDLAISPKKAIISLKNDRGTNYKTYLTVYNELQAAYNELWDQRSNQLFGKKYVDLKDMPDGKEKRKRVRSEIPLVISEAETSFGEPAAN